MANDLPPGFVLDQPAQAALPAGFVLDQPQSPLDNGAPEDWTKAAASATANEPFVPAMEGLTEKTAQGATAHLAPHIAASTGAAANWLARKLGVDIPERTYQGILDEIRGREKAFTTQHPYAAAAAEIGGAMAPGALGARFIAGAPGFFSGMGRAAAVSAPYGAASSGADVADINASPENVGNAMLKGGATSAASGALFQGAGQATARIVGPWATRLAQELSDRGIRLTPGELMGGYPKRLEDSMTSAPFLGAMIRNRQGEGIQDFNRAAATEALSPDRVASRRLGQTVNQTDVGHDLVAEVGNILNARYGQVVPRMTARYDQQLVNDLQAINAQLPATRRAEFRDAIARWVDNSATFSQPGNPLSGVLDGRGLQNAFGGLRDEGRRLITANNSQAYDRDLGNALMDAHEALVDAASRSTNPRTMGDFRRLQQAYAGFTRIRDAASRLGADHGVFTPAQLLNAVRAGDRSAGKGAMATGNALMQNLAGPAKSVMTRNVADSGTPERAAIVAAVLAPAVAAKTLLPLAAPFGLYTQAGNRLFQRMATVSPAARAQIRQLLEAATARGALPASQEIGGEWQ